MASDRPGQTTTKEAGLPLFAHSQTPIRSRRADRVQQQRQPLYEDSSSGSDQQKSFLVLSAESSPIVDAFEPTMYSGSRSANLTPTGTGTVQEAPVAGPSKVMGGDSSTVSTRIDADSSFFPMTSPLASRQGGNDDEEGGGRFASSTGESKASTPVRRLDAPKAINSRGSRLGAQMGRSKSGQHQPITSLQSSPADSHNSPNSTTYNTRAPSSSSTTSPTRKGLVSPGQDNLIGARSIAARIKNDMQEQQSYTMSRDGNRERYTGNGEGVASMASRWDSIAGGSSGYAPPIRESYLSSRGGDREAGAYFAEGNEVPSNRTALTPLAPSAFARQEKVGRDIAREPGDQSWDSSSHTLSSLQEQDKGNNSPRRLSRMSSHGDIYSVASSPPGVISSDRDPGTVPSLVGAAAKVGRLSRLQYNKGDAMAISSGPGWDMSNTSARNVSAFNRRTSLMGRASNPNMLADYKRVEPTSDQAQTAHSSQKSSISSNAQDTVTQTSSVNDHSSSSSSRTGERRELLLPALNGMRHAVQGATTTPTETFMKKGDRRRSSAIHQMNVPPNVSSREESEANHQLSPPMANAVQDFHQRTPSMETNPSPAMTEDTWQRVNEAGKRNNLATAHELSMSSSPMQKAIGTTREARLLTSRQGVKVGQLSDEAIVQLGAVPGVEPSSLLNSNGQSLSSKNILTIALQKAQSAVLLDSSNNVPDAIMAYRQAVRLLEEVMERVSPKNSTRTSRKSSREEERRRLKVIHDTYADRIRLLSMIYSPEDDEPTSLGDESLNGRSASSLHLNSSDDAKHLQGLGIGGEETEMDQKEMPQIAISGETGNQQTVAEDGKEILMDSTYEAKHTSLHRSDSDSSYRSAQGPALIRTGGVPTGLQLPNDRLRSQSNMLNVGGDEDLPTPATPYFDIDPNLVSAAEGSSTTVGSVGDQQDQASITGLRFPPSGERQRSRSPHDRMNRGVSSLHNVPSAKAISADESRSDSQTSRRYVSVGSDALFQKELSNSQSNLVRQPPVETTPIKRTTTEMQSIEAGEPPLNISPSQTPTMSTRARAMTTSEVNRPSETARNLVSSNVLSGTISQRRKNTAGLDGNGTTSGILGGDDESGYGARTLARTFSQSSTDIDTIRDRNAGGTTSPEEREARAGIKASTSGRKRAISQPSNRRPSIPSSFMMNNQNPPGSPHGPPPVPRITRKASMPLSPLLILQQSQQQQQQGTLKAASGAMPSSGTGSGASGFRFPSPAPSTSSGYHALGTPATPFPSYPWSAQTIGGSSSEGKGAILSDIFASPLPSMQMGAIPSFSSNSHPVNLPWIGITNSLPESSSISLPPTQKNLRPFHTMRLLHVSIERGSYITKRLYLPRELWLQQGSRLLAIETKVRMLESISSGIDGIDQAGHFLLHPTYSDAPGLNAINASKFLKLLEEFEIMLIEVQNTLAKKLGFLETVAGKKAGNSFGSLGSKLTRSLDRMTNNSKHLDTPATYIEGLSRLFVRSQVLGDHLSTLHRSKRQSDEYHTSPTRDTEWEKISVDSYATLPAELKKNIEMKLKRFSEFFTNVILRFVLRDVAILMDK